MKLSHFPHECFDIASQNFILRRILAEYRALFIFKVKGLITRSPGHKTGWMDGCRGVKSISIISQYMQSYWFSKQSKINIIYNISVITIIITMSIILANFGKYAISDCPFIILFVFVLFLFFVFLTSLNVLMMQTLLSLVSPWVVITKKRSHRWLQGIMTTLAFQFFTHDTLPCCCVIVNE